MKPKNLFFYLLFLVWLISKPIFADTTTLLFKIDNVSYTEKSFPKEFSNLTEKEQKHFLSKFIYYTIFFKAIEKERKIYHQEINMAIKKELKELKRRGVILSKLQKDILEKRVTVERVAYEEAIKKHPKIEEEVSQFYQKNKNGYRLPNRVEISHIVVKDSNKSKKIIEQLQKNNNQLESFAKLAKIHSLDLKSKHNGGYVGYVSKSSIGQDLFEPIWNTKEKTLLTKALEKNGYYHIIYILKKKKEEQRTLTEEYDNIVNHLLKKDIEKWKDKKYYPTKKLMDIKFYKIKL